MDFRGNKSAIFWQKYNLSVKFGNFHQKLVLKYLGLGILGTFLIMENKWERILSIEAREKKWTASNYNFDVLY